MIKQRIDRHELLSSRNKTPDQAKLRTIDYLHSCAGENEKVVVFGILSQLQEGKYFLEDPSGILQLNLSQAVSFLVIVFVIVLYRFVVCLNSMCTCLSRRNVCRKLLYFSRRRILRWCFMCSWVSYASSRIIQD